MNLFITILGVDITKCHRLGNFNQQRLTSHSLGGWEIQDQGASMVGFWWEPSNWPINKAGSRFTEA